MTITNDVHEQTQTNVTLENTHTHTHTHTLATSKHDYISQHNTNKHATRAR